MKSANILNKVKKTLALFGSICGKHISITKNPNKKNYNPAIISSSSSIIFSSWFSYQIINIVLCCWQIFGSFTIEFPICSSYVNNWKILCKCCCCCWISVRGILFGVLFFLKNTKKYYKKAFPKTYNFPSNFSILFKTEKYVLIFSTSNKIAVKKNIFLKLIDFIAKFFINLIKK